MKERRPAESFPAGEFIKDELEARGWTQEDLAEIMGRDLRLVNEIITGKRGITPETAIGLGEALESSAQYWLNLQSAFQLSQNESQIDHVARRAKLYDKAPVRLMIKRNWIEQSSNIDVLEKRICDYFGLHNIDQEPKMIAHASRQSTCYNETNSLQIAWLYRAFHLSKAINAQKFSSNKLEDALNQLRSFLKNPQDIRMIPRVLSEAGVRFLIIEPLPQSKIDGVTFWTDNCPVVALSLRYDRIDWFWFTLAHELAGHVKHGDGKNDSAVLDIDMLEQQKNADRPQCEIVADREAVDFLVPQTELDSFIARVSPSYSATRIIGFANRINVHPGIIVGQLQHSSRGELSYSQHRDMLVKVRDTITDTALTDGWGHSMPSNI
jgi:HTH-type transcriptional regulator / antitoxin HigA